VDLSSPSYRFQVRAGWLRIALAVIVCVLPTGGQAPKHRLKPTEAAIRHYEKLILAGDLVTPEGWERVSQLFISAEPYPQNGEIQVEWTGTNVMGEEWNNGSRAQVDTKWNDYYGTIDSNLRFKSEFSTAIPMVESFTLVFVPRRSDGNAHAASDAGQGQWKIDTPLKFRIADLPVAITYLERMRDQTTEPTLRRNAERSIKALRRRRNGCGVPNPC